MAECKITFTVEDVKQFFLNTPKSAEKLNKSTVAYCYNDSELQTKGTLMLKAFANSDSDFRQSTATFCRL